MGRAQETLALFLAEVGPLAVIDDDRLMEVGMGALDGMDDVEIETEYPGARSGLMPGAWFFHGPGGERFADFAARLDAVMAEIAADPAPQKVIVARGVVSRVIRGLHAGLGMAEALTGSPPQDAFYALEPGDVVRLVECCGKAAGGRSSAILCRSKAQRRCNANP